MDYPIVRLRDRPELVPAAARWFQHTFGVPEEAYRQSMENMLAGSGPVPQWYLAMDGDRIAGGMGVIENDFHDRPDLTPNVCAVYTDEPYRGKGIAGALLQAVCEDMAGLGIPTLYLVTDHASFYERYGWEFLCMANGDDGPTQLYRRTTRRLTPCGDDCLQCPRYPARTEEELRALAELWHRVGWRQGVPPPEEMRCGGCFPERPCSYGLTDCARARGTESCKGCEEFPCGRIRDMLEKSRAGQARCREVCAPGEYALLERAFFHKEENLGG
ncbi:GNAT family N-acetyltransferase [Acutalibacter sp. 1XD8-33]|uniref:GNAT family N-acetyltransferase n=1 Tax=Acutalibacter sp. 1XD8-33 TaxID=2320081 RepID=UPI000EA29FC0|nr:GNAT family N-acetyltransferase [Acutalibacter sp. 1XD8-33]